MNLTEYARHDATGLADLVRRKHVTPTELARLAHRAIETIDGDVNAVVEVYEERIASLDEASLGAGPFRGVPFLIKDVFGHNLGKRIEFASRLCEGMAVEVQSHICDMLIASGVNILGRSNAPEFSMAGTTENVFHGDCHNPWKRFHAAGGSSGGAAAAVAAGIVPFAHGSDIAGSIRIPAAYCGGVGLKPSRGRVSIGPTVDEGGFGMSKNLVQAKSVRDTATMLDCLSIPQVGDPFVIPKPAESYAALATRDAPKLKVALILDRFFGVPVDAEVATAVRATGLRLQEMGHVVEEVTTGFDMAAHAEDLMVMWFYAFDARLEGYGRRTGRKPGPDTLEPVILTIYEWAKTVGPARFMAAAAGLNKMRRTLARTFATHDVWLTPTAATPALPFGTINLSRQGIPIAEVPRQIFFPCCQFTVPHNVMGNPAISLPLAMHSSGLPIGVQLAARPADEHVLLQLATALEASDPWADRVPPLHVSRREAA